MNAPPGAAQNSIAMKPFFYRDSKKCSLYQTKSEGQSDFQRVDDNTKTRIVRIKKVSKFLNVKKIDFNIVKLGIRNEKFT